MARKEGGKMLRMEGEGRMLRVSCMLRGEGRRRKLPHVGYIDEQGRDE